MPKALCIAGIVIAALVFLIFGLDLAIGLPPFNKASMMMDAAFVVCGAILGYLSWTTLREQE
ncbi:MAG TPA: hypothetical protein VMY42_15965 [Thermoguttaceae bacterium]|nr:hypothetical protein [Thermoguttaceae bacterium]